MYKIAIDVGGTNTDAVICDSADHILSRIKVSTSADIQSGIENAINGVMAAVDISADKITHAMLGTTQCTNAIIERKKLSPVTVIRLAGQSTHAIKPFCDWPVDLIAVTKESSHIVDGGYEYDGQEIAKLNFEQIDECIAAAKSKNFAISSVYAPLKAKQETVVRDYILKRVPDANISISSEIGALSLLERENATILNSSLKEVIKLVANGFQTALKKAEITNAKAFICQNDGTIMDIEYALKRPILTISSGPTNSIRGGAKLVSVDNAIIVDVGGTTTDIGAIVNTLARESQGTTDIGGVASNFRMPDMISIGLGGGTIVEVEGDQIKVGPESVGHRLTTAGLAFGGDTLTLSDVAKRLGRTSLGTVDVTPHLSFELATTIDRIVNEQIASSIELMKVNADSIDVILVGGGSVIVNPDYHQQNKLNLPTNYDVANAIGASIVQISGSHEGIYAMKGQDNKAIVARATERAIENAISSGAKADTIEVVDIEQNPLSYHPEEAYVIKTKVVGDLA